jgi:hypothetical protein
MLGKLYRKNFFYQLKNGVKIEKCPKYGCFTVFIVEYKMLLGVCAFRSLEFFINIQSFKAVSVLAFA